MRNGRLPTRGAFLYRALSLMGTLYSYGGRSRLGIDCSGVLDLALFEAGGPDWRLTHNTDRLWRELPPTVEPEPGDPVFYGGKADDDVDHVMLWLPFGLVFGAAGGDSSTRTMEEATRKNARVKVRDRVLYRDDFRGYRSMAPLFSKEV